MSNDECQVGDEPSAATSMIQRWGLIIHSRCIPDPASIFHFVRLRRRPDARPYVLATTGVSSRHPAILQS